ncbi:hypothetical protein B566_EDAN009395 [Ephemera danica]|nr:hypothetical protein B566_EDAN009395 [Ephemera danica]
MIEAVRILSPNYGYYGDLHNFGHIAIAYCHDPDNRHLQPEGVMFQTETAMRDPIFYRWHAFINDMERTFRELETKSYGVVTSESKKESYCGCGWPENLLVPKGNVEGFSCAPGEKCSGAPYCGVRDKLYPDRRPMGFPFDRKPKDKVTTLEKFLTPNMTTVDVKIQFKNEN